jgi:hypothetical protein
LEHRQLRCDPKFKPVWDKSYANELGRQCQGIGTGASPTSKHVEGTNTFFLINYNDIPTHKCKEICHTLVVCEVHPEKDDPDHTRITIGGSHICYPGDVGTNTASLELVKILLNSVLSRKGVRFSTIDLKNFYLDTPMPDPEYVRIKMTDIPDEFIEEYNLIGRDRDGWVYFEIRQGCYGLPQSGILANNRFVHAWSWKDLMSLSLHQGSGATNGNHYSSASLWTTLVSNMLGLNTSTSYLIYSRNTTEYNLTWPATNSQASLSHGTTQTGVAASACPGTLTICSSSSSILGLQSHASCHMPVFQLLTAPRHNLRLTKMPLLYFLRTVSDAS